MRNVLLNRIRSCTVFLVFDYLRALNYNIYCSHDMNTTSSPDKKDDIKTFGYINVTFVHILRIQEECLSWYTIIWFQGPHWKGDVTTKVLCWELLLRNTYYAIYMVQIMTSHLFKKKKQIKTILMLCIVRISYSMEILT